MKVQGNLSFRSVYDKAQKGSEMHFMAVKTERSEIRPMTQYLIILDMGDMGAVLERTLFLEKNAMISIGLSDSTTILVNQFNNLTHL